MYVPCRNAGGQNTGYTSGSTAYSSGAGATGSGGGGAGGGGPGFWSGQWQCMMSISECLSKDSPHAVTIRVYTSVVINPIHPTGNCLKKQKPCTEV